MANKVKMKCAVCHATFKSSKPTQLLCDNCERKRRQERAAQEAAKPAAKPETSADAGGKPAWLAGAVVRAPDTDPVPALNQRPRPQPAGHDHDHPAPRAVGHVATPARPGKPQDRHDKLPKEARQAAAKAPRPPREHKEPLLPYAPTPEQIEQIEQRYRDLAQPEFDGIRTRIAHDLSLPKTIVKKVIATLLSREHLPSWWEMQRFDGTPEEQEQIKAAYEKYLPVPPLGVHKLIAQEIDMSPIKVYRGIRNVRLALGLPVYNPPETHPELAQAKEQADVLARERDVTPEASAAQ